MSENELAEKIGELWSSEYCSWKVETESTYSKSAPLCWTVDLEWGSDGGNPHEADFATYVWRFYGDDLTEALTAAVDWLVQLAPWEPCGECDGLGAWAGKPCADCNETGLAVA